MVFGFFKKKPKEQTFKEDNDFAQRTEGAPVMQVQREMNVSEQIEKQPFEVPSDQKLADNEVDEHEKMMQEDFKKKGANV